MFFLYTSLSSLLCYIRTLWPAGENSQILQIKIFTVLYQYLLSWLDGLRQ